MDATLRNAVSQQSFQILQALAGGPNVISLLDVVQESQSKTPSLIFEYVAATDFKARVSSFFYWQLCLICRCRTGAVPDVERRGHPLLHVRAAEGARLLPLARHHAPRRQGARDASTAPRRRTVFCNSHAAVLALHFFFQPHNVMIDHAKRQLRLIDWGLAEFYHPKKEYNVRVASRYFKARTRALARILGQLFHNCVP